MPTLHGHQWQDNQIGVCDYINFHTYACRVHNFKSGNKMAVSLTKKKELIYSGDKIQTRKLTKGKIAKITQGRPNNTV